MFVAPKITIAELLAKKDKNLVKCKETENLNRSAKRRKTKLERQEEIAKEVYQWFFKGKKSKLKLK